MSRRDAPVGVGACTILTVLLVLCLATFASLALASAGADARLSTAAAEQTSAYYEADAEAVRIYAQFCAGSTAELETDIPFGDTRQLHLRFSRDELGAPVIDCWSVTVPDELPDTSLPVFTGAPEGAIFLD